MATHGSRFPPRPLPSPGSCAVPAAWILLSCWSAHQRMRKLPLRFHFGPGRAPRAWLLAPLPTCLIRSRSSRAYLPICSHAPPGPEPRIMHWATARMQKPRHPLPVTPAQWPRLRPLARGHGTPPQGAQPLRGARSDRPSDRPADRLTGWLQSWLAAGWLLAGCWLAGRHAAGWLLLKSPCAHVTNTPPIAALCPNPFLDLPLRQKNSAILCTDDHICRDSPLFQPRKGFDPELDRAKSFRPSRPGGDAFTKARRLHR